MSVVQSDEMDLTCDEVWKVGGVPFVVELCPQGVLEFVRVEGQSREPIKVLLVAVDKREGQSRDHVEGDAPMAVTYARLPRELTKPISFGFKSGIRPTPPGGEHWLAENEVQWRAGPTVRLKADVIVVACDWGCRSEWWQHTPPGLDS